MTRLNRIGVDGRTWLRLLAGRQVFDGGIKLGVGDGANHVDSGDFIFGCLADDEAGVPLIPKVPASAVSFLIASVYFLSLGHPRKRSYPDSSSDRISKWTQDQIGGGVEHYGVAHFPELARAHRQLRFENGTLHSAEIATNGRRQIPSCYCGNA